MRRDERENIHTMRIAATRNFLKTRKKLMTTPNRELKIKIDYKKCPIFGRDYNPKIGAINTPPLTAGRES